MCKSEPLEGQRVEERMVSVEDGVKLEVLSCGYETYDSAKPPMVLLHGSYHAAWCWEGFLQHFATLGYSAHALSLRGQGKSQVGRLTDGGAAGTLDTFCSDVAAFAQMLHRPDAVLIVHSFSGLIAQWYMQNLYSPRLFAVCFLCSVPTTGTRNVALRMLLKQPLRALLVTWTFIRKSFVRSERLARLAFFSDDLEREKLQEYMGKLAKSSSVKLLDLQQLSRQYLPLVPPREEDKPLIETIAAANDNIIDLQSARELADVYGSELTVLDNIAHDVMLDTRWVKCAETVASFLERSLSNS